MKKKKILISPWSRPRTDGKQNAKNYPYWNELAIMLDRDEYDVIQLIHGNEQQLLVNGITFKKDLTLPQIEKLVLSCDTFVCVDNFLHHLGHYVGVRGFVLYGVSDPSLFGYDTNINIYAGRKYFRQYQFQTWNEVEFNAEAFVNPNRVFEIIKTHMPVNVSPIAGETLREEGADFVK
jgi:ADP-heptose:LPS heptosyltransferase